MTDLQVRRVPIVDADGRCVGIVAQADIALAAKNGGDVTDREVARVVQKVSEPAFRGTAQPRRASDRRLEDEPLL